MAFVAEAMADTRFMVSPATHKTVAGLILGVSLTAVVTQTARQYADIQYPGADAIYALVSGVTFLFLSRQVGMRRHGRNMAIGSAVVAVHVVLDEFGVYDALPVAPNIGEVF